MEEMISRKNKFYFISLGFGDNFIKIIIQANRPKVNHSFQSLNFRDKDDEGLIN